MHLLLESSTTSLPQFASISVLLEECKGESVLSVVSPLCTTSHNEATACLAELHEHIGVQLLMMRRRRKSNATKMNGHGRATDNNSQETTAAEDSPRSYDSDDVSLFWNDKYDDAESTEVFRPLAGHGIALYYRVIYTDATTAKPYTSMLLLGKAGRSSTTSITGVIVCVGVSGWQNDSSLYVEPIEQVVGMMQSMTAMATQNNNNNESARRALESVLQTLILTDIEERKTNAIVKAEKSSAAVSVLLEDVETGDSKSSSKKRTGKSKHHSSRHEQQQSAGIHLDLETESSADTARITTERLAVLSLAENDVALKPYEVSGRQRQTNFETEMAGRSRVRLRRRKSTTEDADLEDFDCPVARTETTTVPALKPPSQVRTTRSLTPDVSNLNRAAVPTLVAPRGDVAKIGVRRSLQPQAVRPSKLPEALDMFADTNGPTSPDLQEVRKATSSGGFSDNFGFEADAFALKPPDQLKITPATQTAGATGFDPFSPLDASPRGATPKSVASAASSTLTTPSPSAQHAIDIPGLSASASHVSGGFAEGDWASPTSPEGQKSLSEAMAAPVNVTPGDETPRMSVNVALNEDLTVSYRQSKISSCSIEGVVQVRVSLSSSNGVPFFLYVRDALKHIKLIQENRRYADDITQAAVDQDEVGADYKFTVSVPGSDKYYPVMRYKCNPDLRPVPMRVQTRVRLHDGVCRIALQISSNPTNEDELTDLTIVMGVPPEIKGETLTTSPAGGVWNESKRSVVWCVAELGGGEKFQLVAQFRMDPESFAVAEAEKPKFPVLVRCQCMHSQLSAIELEVSDIPEIFPADVSMKLARRFRLSHRERS